MRRTLLAIGLFVAGVAGADDSAVGGWQLELTPYLMLPGVEASIGLSSPDGDPSVDSGPSDVLALINMAVMLKAEARRERVFLFVDWMYLDMGNADSVIGAIEFPDGTVPVGASLTLDSDASFDGFMVMVGGGYRVLDEARGELELYGGVRTLNLSTSLSWTLTAAITSPGGGYTVPASGEIGGVSESWDAVLGVRGALHLAERWRAFGLADHGWGDGTASWQGVVGLRWLGDSTAIELAWREIAWERIGPEKQGSLRLYGPVIGATFRF
jgi:hypothetical protein